MPGCLAVCAGLVAALLVGTAGCTRIPARPDVETADDRFSGEQALGHLEALASLGARPPGSRSDELARLYLKRELRLLGASFDALADGERRHLDALIPGGSPDTVLLLAPLPTLSESDALDDSGVALVLELARVLSMREQPFSLRLIFAEVRAETPEAGRAVASEALETQAAPEPADAAGAARTPMDDTRARVVEAGERLVRVLEAEDALARIRLVVAFDSLGRARLRVAQDLRSHPVFRAMFWRSAALLGFEPVFPSDGRWSSPRSLHLGFREQGLSRVVALVDERLARPGLSADPMPEDHSAASLAIVGTVSVEALGQAMQRLEKIDALSRAP